jgi:hypothetical protein
LKEVVISNGRELFRRFVLSPSSANATASAAHVTHAAATPAPFFHTLLLDGYVHRNLVLEVTESACLVRHFILKTIVLPRQARDKHRGNSKKGHDFCR